MRTAIVLLLGALSGCAFNYRYYDPDESDEDIAWAHAEEGFIAVERGRRIHYAFAKPVGVPKATVLAVRGDGGNLAQSERFVRPFVDNGYAAFIFDYPGYGKSDGRPTHRSVLQAANAALTHVLARPDVRGSKLLVAGFSLGGQLAIVLTARRQHEIDALLVEATYTSHRDIAEHVSVAKRMARAFVRGPYSAEESIRTITIPKLIVHSRYDQSIPYAMGVQLHRDAPLPKELWTIDGDHMQGFERYPQEYVARVDALLGVTTPLPPSR
jgi:pimeloyl-ACP methyl ester carboxylesterase